LILNFTTKFVKLPQIQDLGGPKMQYWNGPLIYLVVKELNLSHFLRHLYTCIVCTRVVPE